MISGITKALNFLLLLDFSFFLVIAPYSKIAVKIVLYVALFLGTLLIIMNSYGVFYKKDTICREFFRGFIPRNPVSKATLFFLSIALVAAGTSINFLHSQRIFFERYLPYLLFFAFGVYSAKSRNVPFILTVIFFINIIVFSLGISIDHLKSPDIRISTSFGRSLNLSNYLILAAPFSSIVFVFTKSRILRICGFFTAFLSSISLIWIESRAGWLAVPIATLLVCFRRNIKAGFLLTVILVVAANFLGPVYKIRALTTFDVSSWSRIELYETALRIFKSYPVLGSGPGMYEKLVNSVEFRPINGYLGQVVHPHAHNTYLEILSEMGIVGLIGFSSIFIAFFSFLFKSKKIWDETVGEQSVLLIGISGSILATLIFALASTIITVGMQDAPVFWFLFGIASGLLPPFFIDKRSV